MSFRARLVLIVGFGTAALVFARLGVWQVDRLKERRAANRAAFEARMAPPVRLDGRVPISTALSGRRISAKGR